MKRVETQMRLTLMMALLLLSAGASAGEWVKEPRDFKGVVLGGTENELNRAMGWEQRRPCRQRRDPERSCSAWITIGDVRFSTSFTMNNDEVVAIRFPVSAYEYALIREAFLERYGEPHASVVEPWTNRMGTTFDNEVLTWAGEKVRVSLTQRGYSRDVGEAEIVYLPWARQKEAEAKERAAAVAKTF